MRLRREHLHVISLIFTDEHFFSSFCLYNWIFVSWLNEIEQVSSTDKLKNNKDLWICRKDFYQLDDIGVIYQFKDRNVRNS